MTPVLQSYIAGRWLGLQSAVTLSRAANGRAVGHTQVEAIDLAEALYPIRFNAGAGGGGQRRLGALMSKRCLATS